MYTRYQYDDAHTTAAHHHDDDDEDERERDQKEKKATKEQHKSSLHNNIMTPMKQHSTQPPEEVEAKRVGSPWRWRVPPLDCRENRICMLSKEEEFAQRCNINCNNKSARKRECLSLKYQL